MTHVPWNTLSVVFIIAYYLCFRTFYSLKQVNPYPFSIISTKASVKEYVQVILDTRLMCTWMYLFFMWNYLINLSNSFMINSVHLPQIRNTSIISFTCFHWTAYKLNGIFYQKQYWSYGIYELGWKTVQACKFAMFACMSACLTSLSSVVVHVKMFVGIFVETSTH